MNKVTLDTPESICDRKVVRFSGWMAVKNEDRETVKFYLNGKALHSVIFFSRSDIPNYSGYSSFGWSVFVEIDVTATRLKGSVDLLVEAGCNEIFSRNIPVGGYNNLLTLFMHVPRTGGTSLRLALEKSQRLGKSLMVYNTVEHLNICALEQLSKCAFDNLDLVSGHFHFGAHRFTTKPYRYVSFLRRPYEALISLYYHQKHVMEEDCLKDRSIFDAIEADYFKPYSNYFTRYFAGIENSEEVTEASFKVAVENIKNEFAFVGLAEFRPQSYNRLACLIGESLNVEHHNRTPFVAERNDIDLSRFRRSARRYVELDLQIYCFIQEYFWGGSDAATPASVKIDLASSPSEG